MQLQPIRSIPFLLLAALPLAVGCGISANTPNLADQPSAAITGRAMGGQQPVVGATVTVWAVGTSGYGTGATQLAATTTDAGGNFAFAAAAYTCPFANTPIYILGAGGNPGMAAGTNNPNLVLGAALGNCATAKSAFVSVNEVTTTALAFSLGQFFTPTVGGAYTTDLFGGTAPGGGVYNVGLVAAANNTYPMLVSNAAGMVNPSSAAITIESAKLYTIANILAACVNTAGQTSTTDTTSNCGKLFNSTKPATGARPLDTLQAAVQLSRIPYQNVAALYNLPSASPAFGGGLTTTPNDWTVAVAYTFPTLALGINGCATSRTTSTIDIDATGKVWFPSTATGKSGIAYFDPASQTIDGPYITGLVHPQYLEITPSGLVYATDLNDDKLGYTSTTAPIALGTLSTSSGIGFTGPITQSYDPSDTTDGATYFTAGGTSTSAPVKVYVIKSGVLSAGLTLRQPATGLIGYYNAGSTIQIATSGSSTTCQMDDYYNSGGATTDALYTTDTGTPPCYTGGISGTSQTGQYGGDYLTPTSTGHICELLVGTCYTPPLAFNLPEGIAVDGAGMQWIANSGNGSVVTFNYVLQNTDQTDVRKTSTVPYLHNAANGGTMTTPYGLAIDRSGNLWTSNASCVTTTATPCTATGFTLTEIIGVAAPSITPLSSQVLPNKSGVRPTN